MFQYLGNSFHLTWWLSLTPTLLPGQWASSRLWRPLGTRLFLLWVPTASLHKLSLGDGHIWNSHFCYYGFRTQRVLIRIKSKLCFVNVLPIEAKNKFCKLAFVNQVISTPSRCSHVTLILTMMVSWFSSWQWGCVQTHETLVWVHFLGLSFPISESGPMIPVLGRAFPRIKWDDILNAVCKL